MSKHLFLIVATLFLIILAGGCAAEEEPLTAEQKVCVDAAKEGCKLSAEKACEGKSGYAKTVCEQSSIEACMAAAREGCVPKKSGS